MIGTRNPGCRQIIDNAFRQAAVLPTYVFRSYDTPTIEGLSAQVLPTPYCRSSQWTKTIQALPSSPSDPSPRPAGSGSHGIPAQTASGPAALCQHGNRNLSRPPGTMGCGACRVTTTG